MAEANKTKLLQIINSFSLAGAEKIAIDLALRLDKDRFDVGIVAIGAKEDAIEAELRAELETNGIQTFVLGKLPRKERLKTIWRLSRIIKMYNPDILHTHSPSPDFYGKISATLAKTPFVVSTIHNTQGYNPWIETLLRPLTSVYVAISETVRQYALQQLKLPKAEIEVIYNGIDPFPFEHRGWASRGRKVRLFDIPEQALLITTIGRVTTQKGHIYLVEAFKEVVREFPDAYLCIVGDETVTPLVAEHIRSKVKEYGLEERVLFTGVRKDIPEILAATDVFVLPSLWEGLSVVLLEAMASGLPVVATAVGSNPEIIRDGVNGFLVPPKNPPVLAERIREVLQDPEMAKKVGLEARKTVQEKFSLQSMVRAYENLYLRLILSKSRE